MSKIAVMKKNGKYYMKNKPVPVYWKELTWEQPILTSNGIMGGSSFAVSALNTDSRTAPYYAFDSNKADTWTAGWLSQASDNYLQWYNPQPINITKLLIQYQTTSTDELGYINNWRIEASNNNVDYTEILTGTTGNYGTTTIDINHEGYYKYWRFYVLGWSSAWYAIIDMQITATQIVELIPIKEDSTTKYECSYYTAWTQPVLTSDATSTSLGTIYTSASSWYNDNTRPYKIMTGSISSTVDAGYWQIYNSTSEQWLLIQFPYKLKIYELSVVTRPRDNYNRTFSVYTNSNKTQKIGNTVTTSAALTRYTIASGGAYVTDKLYFAVNSGGDGWWGLQDLQIRADRLIEETIDNYDYTTERNTYNAWLKG